MVAVVNPEYLMAQALDQVLERLVTNPVTSISWPNVEFNPDVFPYLRAFSIPSSPGIVDLRGRIKEHSGEYQVSIIEARNVGLRRAYSLAGQIISHFHVGHHSNDDGTAQFEVISPPNVGAPIISDTEVMIPVQIRYKSISGT